MKILIQYIYLESYLERKCCGIMKIGYRFQHFILNDGSSLLAAFHVNRFNKIGEALGIMHVCCYC